jgi:hypothetical protein
MFEFLRDTFIAAGGVEFFTPEHISVLPPEMRSSWRAALGRLIWGLLPRTLKPANPQEAAELELLFLGLRHADSVPAIIAKHATLIDRWDYDPAFRRALARTIDSRRNPDKSKITSLQYYVLSLWLSGGLCLLDNEDRAKLLRISGCCEDPQADAVRKAVDKLGLIDWTHFQAPGTRAPFFVNEFSEDGELKCEIVLKEPASSDPGKF